MNTDYLQEDELISSFNGSYRKALEKKDSLLSDQKTTALNPDKNKKKKNETIPLNHSTDSKEIVRVSISKRTDQQVRETINKKYIESGIKVSIKHFVEECISFYLKKNNK